MAQSSWNFNGNPTTNNPAYRSNYMAQLAGIANGGPALATNGGYASMWEGTLNSSLTPALAVGGDYCRSLIFSGGTGTSGSIQGWLGMNLLKESEAGGTYPVTVAPTVGNLWAYSIRAFLRIECEAGQQDNGTPGDSGVGTFVGVQGKSAGGSSEFNGSTAADNIAWRNGLGSGYGLILSSANHINLDPVFTGNDDTGYGSPGGNDIRLILTAAKENDADDSISGNHNTVLCAAPGGGYQNNIWYHVRLDILGGVDGDTIEAYTAPITDVIGSETWTLVGTMNIDISDPFYTTWVNTTSDQIGWVWGGKNDVPTATQKMSDAHIDRFQFFTKNTG